MGICLSETILTTLTTHWDYRDCSINCFAWEDAQDRSHRIKTSEIIASIVLPILAGLEIALITGFAFSVSIALPIVLGITVTLVMSVVFTAHFKANDRYKYLYLDFIEMCKTGTQKEIQDRILEGATGFRKNPIINTVIENEALKWTCFRKMGPATKDLLAINSLSVLVPTEEKSKKTLLHEVLDSTLITSLKNILLERLETATAVVNAMVLEQTSLNTVWTTKASTALDLAVELRDKNVLSLLLKKGADPFIEADGRKVDQFIKRITSTSNIKYIMWELFESKEFVAKMKEKYAGKIPFDDLEKAFSGKTLALAYLMSILDQQQDFDVAPIERIMNLYCKSRLNRQQNTLKKGQKANMDLAEWLAKSPIRKTTTGTLKRKVEKNKNLLGDIAKFSVDKNEVIKAFCTVRDSNFISEGAKKALQKIVIDPADLEEAMPKPPAPAVEVKPVVPVVNADRTVIDVQPQVGDANVTPVVPVVNADSTVIDVQPHVGDTKVKSDDTDVKPDVSKTNE